MQQAHKLRMQEYEEGLNALAVIGDAQGFDLLNAEKLFFVRRIVGAK